MTKDDVIFFKAELGKALEEFGKKHNLTISLPGNTSFNSNTFKFRVEVSRGGLLEVTRRELEEKNRDLRYHLRISKGALGEDLEVPENIIGSFVSLRGNKRAKIIDYKKRNTRYPIIVEIEGKKGQYKISSESIRSLE